MNVFIKIHRLGRSYDTIKIDLSLHILIITGGVGLYALGFRIILGIHGIVDTLVGISFVQDMPRLRGCAICGRARNRDIDNNTA